MQKKSAKTQNQILTENDELRKRLDEAQEALRAIRSSEVDALTVSGAEGEQVFTLAGADHTYRVLIETINEGALTLSAEGVILFANRRFAEMLKTPLEKVIGTTIHNWIAAESLPALQSLLRKNGGKKHREQFVLKASDGPVSVLLSMSRMLIKGLPDSFCLVATDLTEQIRGDKIAASGKLSRELLTVSNQSRLALLSMIEDQKRVEEALRESEERFRSLYENATIGMYRTTPDGRVLMANQALLKMLGFRSYKEMARRNLNKEGFEVEKARQEFQRQIQADGKVHGYESTWRTRNGGTVYVRESARVVRDQAGRVQYYEGTVEDISARRKAENAQREMNEKIAFQAALLNQVRNAVIATDLDGRIIYLNKFAEFLYQWPAQEALGRTVIEVTVPDINKQAAEDIMLSLKKKGYWEGEFNVRRRNGEVFPAFVVDVVVKDDKGQPAGYVGISAEISDRIKSRKALEESEERFRGLFEDSPVSLWLEDFSAAKKRVDALRARGVKDMRAYLDAHPEEVSNCAALTRITDVNKAGVSLFKAKTKADLLKNLSKILSPQSMKEFRQELVYLAEGQTNFRWEGKSLTLDGELIDTNLSWSVVPGYESDLSRVLVSVEDITERKKFEAALQESEGRFRSLFEDSPVSLWEEDFSAVKQRLDTLRAEGVTDMHAHLEAHPEEVKHCISMVRVIDINKATLALFRAGNKDELITNIADILSQAEKDFGMELELMAQGRTRFSWEGVNQTLAGDNINVSIIWAAAPGHETDLSRVIVSITDITERKQAEVEMQRLVEELRGFSELERKNRLFAEALAKNVTILNSSLNANVVLDSIIDSIEEIVPFDVVSVMMIEGRQSTILRSRGFEEKGLAQYIQNNKFDFRKYPTFQKVIKSGTYLLIPDTRKDPSWVQDGQNSWKIFSNIQAPIKDGSAVVGFLNLGSAVPGFYNEEHAKRLMSFSDQVSTALKNARLFEDTQRRMKRMQAMTQIDLAINSSLDINVSLEIVMIQAKDQLNADAVDILLVNKATNTLVFSKAKGFKTDEIRKSSFRLGTGLPGRAVLERTLIAIPDLSSTTESYFRNMLVEREGFVSYYCIPLVTKGELKGVMEVYFRQPFTADQEWQEFLEILAQQTAIAINNAELLDSLKISNADLMNAYDTTLKGWVDALDMRDHENEGHTRRVAELALQLARRMGVQDVDIVNFQRGALLHDIGKVAVPDAILNKPGPLTDEEWTIMRRHPLIAYQLLSKSKYLIPALDIPYCHHEKWDGSGYPRGLKGEAIPLAARIFAIVDVWDALISDRPYRKAWTRKQALDHIQEQSGKHFDPKVVSAFLTMIKTTQVTP